MPICSDFELRQLTCALLERVGTPTDAALFVGNSLVDANLAGHDSHGVIRIIQYLEVVESGALDPAATPEVAAINGATVKVDGKWGWGQPAMQLATLQTIELAREHGIAIGVVDRCFHIGRVAPYVEAIARVDMVGMAMANAGPAVAPYGGRTRVMGTNPLAWAVPRAAKADPVSLDVASAAIAEGKLRVARAKGMPAPAGAVMNSDGFPSVDPNEFYDGGALVAFGGHKGSGFSIFAQLLGRGLAGMTPNRLAVRRGGNGPIVIAIDVSFLTPLQEFLLAVEDQVERVTGADPAEGFEAVLLPGEPEIRERRLRKEIGIPIDDRTWQSLMEIAERMDISTSAWNSNLDTTEEEIR